MKNKQEMYISKGVTYIVIIGILWLAYLVLQPFLGILSSGMIFAIFLRPFFKKLLTITRNNSLAGLLTVLAALLFVVVPLGFLIGNLVSELVTVATDIQKNPGRVVNFHADLNRLLTQLQIPFDVSLSNFNNYISQVLSFMVRNVGGLALQSGSMVLSLFFTLLTVYFLLVNWQGINKYIEGLSIFPQKYYVLLTKRTIEIVNGTVRGNLLIILLQSLVGIIGFLVFGIPSAFLLGVIYGLSSLLPLVGGFLLWIPLVLWQVIGGNTLSAILLAIWFLGLGFVVENLIAPKIIGKSTNLHQLIVMFSVFGGIQQFGLSGMILGPVVIALTFIALEIVKQLNSEGQTKFS
ncbi:AI-2E family transporter [Candidatus Woesebacteria bacterium]|nr:MAG: AI-2E family transporter [Candidatus Woesebacteria bacterium]